MFDKRAEPRVNELEVSTSKGGTWHAATVLRIMKRLEGSDRAVIA
jgi:hypothetical protein